MRGDSFSPAITQQNEVTYDYRNDGARTQLVIASESSPFAWNYKASGRVATQSDPLTGLTATQPATTDKFQAKSFSYNGYGQLSALALPGDLIYTIGTSQKYDSLGLQYKSLNYTTDGELAGFSTNASTASGSTFPISLAYQYDTLGEATFSAGYSGVGSGLLAAGVYAQANECGAAARRQCRSLQLHSRSRARRSRWTASYIQSS